uniref:Uncharacterized protein n=1 Tax=Panagrolaimus sp. JU765 TaxID=591449 RepID=A0AC34RS39_9BILA
MGKPKQPKTSKELEEIEEKRRRTADLKKRKINLSKANEAKKKKKIEQTVYETVPDLQRQLQESKDEIESTKLELENSKLEYEILKTESEEKLSIAQNEIDKLKNQLEKKSSRIDELAKMLKNVKRRKSGLKVKHHLKNYCELTKESQVNCQKDIQKIVQDRFQNFGQLSSYKNKPDGRRQQYYQ